MKPTMPPRDICSQTARDVWWTGDIEFTKCVLNRMVGGKSGRCYKLISNVVRPPTYSIGHPRLTYPFQGRDRYYH